MNKFRGHIVKITTSGNMSIIEVDCNDVTLKTIVLETPDTAAYLTPEQSVDIVFKETEVVIGLDEHHNISLQNRIRGNVQEIVKGELLSRVIVSTKIGSINSVITTNAVKQLNINVGDPVVTMVKTNEIMISVC